MTGRPARVNPKDREQLAQHPVTLGRVVSLFRPERGNVTTVMGIIVVISLLGMVPPFLLRAVVDDAIPRQNVPLLVWCVAGMVGITAVMQLLGVVQTWMAAAVGQRVMHTLRTSLFDHLQKQSLGFFTRTRGGEVQSRLVNDISAMQGVLTGTATSIASNVTTVAATAIAMVVLSPRLSLLTLVVLPPAVWMTRRVALLRREITAERQRTMARLHAQVEDGLSVSGVRLTKTLGTAGHMSERFADTSRELIGLELRSQLAGRWRMATMQILFAVIPAAIYLVAGLPATSGGMTIGTLVAFTTLQASIFMPLMGVLNVGSQWVSSMALFSRIFEYLDLAPDVPEPEAPVTVDRTAVAGRVEFDHVTLRYPGSDRDAVHDVTLHIPPGGTLALVGHTGSGKSTIAHLAARLVDPTEGYVRVDGVDVRDMRREDLSTLVGVVSQESYLAHTTIRENLRAAQPDADDAALWRALGVAQVADLVAGLPEGLDTVVGARGLRFSGGEVQRLAIARTLLRDPPILVLDEATSALDTQTERAVQEALDRLAVGRTTLVIAHRLSTVRNADQIAVLDAGQLVETGTHDELIRRIGVYHSLAARDAREPASVPDLR